MMDIAKCTTTSCRKDPIHKHTNHQLSSIIIIMGRNRQRLEIIIRSPVLTTAQVRTVFGPGEPPIDAIKRNQNLLITMTIFKKRRSPQNVPTYSCITLATYGVPTDLAGNSRSTVESCDLNHYLSRQIQGKSKAKAEQYALTMNIHWD